MKIALSLFVKRFQRSPLGKNDFQPTSTLIDKWIMITVNGYYSKLFWDFLTDSRFAMAQTKVKSTRKRGRPLSFIVGIYRYNITRDTFTLHNQPKDPFTFLYTHIHTVAGPIAMPVCLTLLVFHQYTFHFGCLSPDRNWQAF